MLDKIPDGEELTALIGRPLYGVWLALCSMIEEKYDMERLWNTGGKAWTYEYKYRRAGKTLCGLYARENSIGFMVILGREEREKFEQSSREYSERVRKTYEQAKTYHDGKWLMFEIEDASLFDDFIRLLSIKRKPNKKQTCE